MEGRREPLLPAVVVRVVALWIFAGAAFKLFLATPADLPRLARDLPLDVGLTFRLLTGVELFVSVFAILRPRRGWILEAALLLAFLAALAVQISHGEASCGCMGSKVKIAPAVMFAIDGALLLVLLASRPWHLAPTRVRRDLGFAAIVLVLAAIPPIVVDRQGTGTGPFRRWVLLQPDQWVGRTVAQTPLAEGIDAKDAPDGLWLIYRDTCHVCAMCLEKMTREEQGQRDVVLVLLPRDKNDEEAPAVHRMPEGSWVHHYELPDTLDWAVTPPSDFVVENGRIVSGRFGIEPKDCQ